MIVTTITTELSNSFSRSVLTQAGVNLTFTFLWNNSKEFYYLNITDNDVPVLSGVKLIMGNNLLWGYDKSYFPTGVLFVLGSTVSADNPTKTNIVVYTIYLVEGNSDASIV